MIPALERGIQEDGRDEREAELDGPEDVPRPRDQMTTAELNEFG
jgi:hypothetical protein